MTETDELFAEVILPLPLEKSFHYSVPAVLRARVKPGSRVQVPFGRMYMTGFVLGLVPETSFPGIKDIAAVLDDEPVVTPELLSLAKWISGTYLCTLGEALGAVIPSSVLAPKREPKTVAEPSPAFGPAPDKPVLTTAQASVVETVRKSIEAGEFAPYLLHGVTGSGKTEVYLALIEETLKRDKAAVFLLPEISLTPQFIGIVRKRFPGVVGIWHSNLSAGERYRTWDAARRGKVKILLGARSAVFAPFRKTGLIIIDEEHEPTYKQEQKPSYHTREVALQRGRLCNAVVLFGSATPSMETYYRALNGEFALLELAERIVNRPLPPVKIVDASKLTKGSKILSVPLMDTLMRVLARREQAIIFLNRRGFAPGVICHECGQVWQCPRCSISLVYHRDPEGLHCHYCDYHEAWPGVCPHCGKKSIALFGVGTQRVEEELKKLFPQGRVCRLDRDTASKKGVYQKVYEDFKKENVDILLGTQMVAKGFDFPRVTMVGVVDADTALYLPDFRSAERTFQLITQVAGRSGRGKLDGQVVVQSRHPEHYALAAATKHDFKGFYAQEIEFRKQMNYPPFCRLVNVLIRGKKEDRVEEGAKKAGEELCRIRKEKGVSLDVLGPTQASRYKLHNLFRWQLLLKGEPAGLLTVAAELKKIALPSGVLMSVDVDPQDTL